MEHIQDGKYYYGDPEEVEEDEKQNQFQQQQQAENEGQLYDSEGHPQQYQEQDYQEEEQEQNPEEQQQDQDQEEQQEQNPTQEQVQEQSKQETGSIENKISFELEEKLRVLEDFLQGKNEEQILNIRMHQLAISKILVFTHEKSQYLLVKAHTNLGQDYLPLIFKFRQSDAYLNYKCHEQAIDHLTIALKKNGKLFNEVEESQAFHAHILSLLGKSYLEIGSNEDALELLQKSLEIQTELYGQGDINQAANLTLIANCYKKMKNYDTAIQYIEEVWKMSEQKYGYESESSAFAFLELAVIYALKLDYQKAIECQERSIKTLMNLKYEKPEFVAEQYATLAGYYEQIKDHANQINNLHKVKFSVQNIYAELYGQNDKKVIKVKRQISINLLKAEQHQEALQELLETEDMEIKFYGDSSLQVAKTQKIIGTIFILTKQPNEALKYLSKAQKVFEEHGMKKAVNEIKQKIGIVKNLREKEKNTASKFE